MKIYYASDVHGSEVCWRKFLNAGSFYRADVLIMGGDIVGKAIVPITSNGHGAATALFRGRQYELNGESETEGLFGLPEPVGDLLGPIAINDVDLILVPAAAVDATGMRMGWGRGYFDMHTLEEINRAIAARLADAGVALDGVYCCPHHPAWGCTCRKPAPGMLLRAAADWELDLTTSHMLGDRPTDLEAGRAAGANAFLLPLDSRADAWARLTTLLA